MNGVIETQHMKLPVISKHILQKRGFKEIRRRLIKVAFSQNVSDCMLRNLQFRLPSSKAFFEVNTKIWMIRIFSILFPHSRQLHEFQFEMKVSDARADIFMI